MCLEFWLEMIGGWLMVGWLALRVELVVCFGLV